MFNRFLENNVSLVVLLSAFLLPGCSGLGQVEDSTKISSDDVIAIERVMVIPTGSLDKHDYVILDRASGLSCQGNRYAPMPTKNAAIEQLKMKAGKLRADAVTNIACKDSGGFDWANNCMRSVKCVGDIIRIKTDTRKDRPAPAGTSF